MARTNASEARDIYQEVTDRIVEALEQGVAPWTQPWACVAHKNATTGKDYRGINQILLMVAAANRGYETALWLTFNQARELGGCVKKGERGTTVVFWRMLEKEVEGSDKPRRIPFARAYTVFNVAQTTVEPSKYAKHLTGSSIERHADADAAIVATGATIKHGGLSACYIPSSDEIHMPAASSFESAAAYYATVLHELTHWTGNKARCDRDMSHRFGEDGYAAEELVAELGSAFLCARFGIVGKVQHPEYIGFWLKVLKGDKRAIFAAASAATKAADFVLGAAETVEEVQEAA